MKNIFLSYAKEDYDTAIKLYNDLKRNGLNPWMDSEDLLPGEIWENAILNQIENCSHFIVLLSSNSVTKRGFIQKEINTALTLLENIPDSEIYIIPIRLDICLPVHRKLKNIQWLDLFKDYSTGLKKILKVLLPGNNDDVNEYQTEKSNRYHDFHIEYISLSGKIDNRYKITNVLNYIIKNINSQLNEIAKNKTSELKKIDYLILGDTGSGKSTLSLKIYDELAYSKKVIPVLINLDDYSEELQLKNLQCKCNVNNIKKVDDIIQSDNPDIDSKFILIIDSFDKMTIGATYIDKIKNLRTLKSIYSNVNCLSVCIFVRTHFFKDVLEEDLIGFKKIYLLPFTDQDVNTIFQEKKVDPDTLKSILKDKNLIKIYNRPILCKMFLSSYKMGEFRLNQINNILELVKVYITNWLVREQLFSILPISKKEFIMSMIAIETFKNKGKKIKYDKIDRIIRKKEFDITSKELESFNSDIRTCTFLTRNKHDEYEFIHDLFYEYFITINLLKNFLSENLELFGFYFLRGNILETFIDFLKNKNDEKKQIYNIIPKLWNENHNIRILCNLVDLYIKINGKISDLNFKNRHFYNLNTDYYSFENANVNKTIFNDCSFIGSIFSDNFIIDSTFENSQFDYSVINDVMFENCIFNNCSFKYSKIINCNFKRCKFLNIKFELSKIKVKITNSDLNDIFISSEKPIIDITYSNLQKIWHDQRYDLSNISYFSSDIDQSTMHSLSSLLKNNRPKIDFSSNYSIDYSVKLPKKKLKKKNAAREDWQNKLQDLWSERTKDVPIIDSKIIKIDSEEKLFESFLSGKSISEQKELRRQRDRTKKLIDNIRNKKKV